MSRQNYLETLIDSQQNTIVSESHFGTNFVAGFNHINPDGNFERIVQGIGADHIRYPGGTVTETYFDPNGEIWHELFENGSPQAIAADGRIIEGPANFFEFASNNNLEVTFVLPTASLVRTVNGRIVVDEDGVEKVHRLVSDILEGRFGDVDIRAFEIGNEYYAAPNMSAEEYSAVANELIIAVDDAIQGYVAGAEIDESWQVPDIAVQSGAGWQSGDNETIIEGLSPDAIDSVTSVVAHFYSGSLDAVSSRDVHLNQISEWEDATGNTDLDYHISEWNVSGSDTGMAQASTMISAFDEMLEHNVDSASVWGAQFRWLNCGLSINNGSDDLNETDSMLSVGGELFASLSESLVGLHSIDVSPGAFLIESDTHNTSNYGEDYLVNVFGNEDRAVVYISSRSDSYVNIDLRLDRYFDNPNHIWGETLTSRDDPDTGWRDESGPTSPYGIADFETFTRDDLDIFETITLEPYEILRINIQLSDEGVLMQDHDPMIASDLDYNDLLIGSDYGDTIIAHIGDDRLFAGLGNDIIIGGEGSDEINGSEGDDLAFGGSGDDEIKGDGGRDWIVGGDGHDEIFGGVGDDILSGTGGDDNIRAGDGDDIVSGGEGSNDLAGESGADYFVIASGSRNVIEDFDASEGDKITFLGQFDSLEDLIEHSSSTDPTGEQQGDLIVNYEDGSQVVFVGAAEDQDALFSSVVDFTEEGQNALALADQLNGYEAVEVSNYMDSLNTEGFENVFGSMDGVILFSNLEADTAARLLNSLNPDELDNFLSSVAPEGLELALGEMTDDEKYTFLSSVDDENLDALLGIVGETEITGIILGLSPVKQIDLLDKYFPEAIEQSTPDIDETRPSSSIEDGDQDQNFTENPRVTPDLINFGLPRPSESEFADDDDEDENSAFADCFVATVAYADGQHPDVWLLRWYRDAVMRQSVFGRISIALYWYLGPKLAEIVSGRPNATRTFRKLIEIIVKAIGKYYNRTPGLQADQPHLVDSRKLKLRQAISSMPFRPE